MWLEYKLAYYDSAVHHFNHYTTRTPPPMGSKVTSDDKDKVKASKYIHKRVHLDKFHFASL